jgi:hypothetical protein
MNFICEAEHIICIYMYIYIYLEPVRINTRKRNTSVLESTSWFFLFDSLIKLNWLTQLICQPERILRPCASLSKRPRIGICRAGAKKKKFLMLVPVEVASAHALKRGSVEAQGLKGLQGLQGLQQAKNVSSRWRMSAAGKACQQQVKHVGSK